MSDLDVGKKGIKGLSTQEFQKLAAKVLTLQQADLRENQILYYKPVSKKAAKVHFSTAKVLAAFGGNGSSKTETMLVEMMICVTGVIPNSLKNKFDRKKLKGPINCRVVVESLTTTLYPVILPKLQWWVWTGLSSPGGPKGHWGWIPRMHLIDGAWEKSWKDSQRVLKVKYRDPEHPELDGISTIQFMSKDQDSTDFASGEYEIIIHDEPPSLAIWTENEARTMRVNGRMLLAMTWPDEPTIPVDWIFDKIYDQGAGINKSPHVEWVNLWTTDNPHLDQKSVALQAQSWSEETKQVRIYGGTIRFSHRIHPLFTDMTQIWCHRCKKTIIPEKKACPTCGSDEVTEFNHVTSLPPSRNWPVIFVLDPHPRKPHMFSWVQVDPSDDLWLVAEGEVNGDPVEVKKFVDRVESELGLQIRRRLIDPNMGASPSGAQRGITWQREFDDAGLFCDLSDDSDVGRGRINEYLKPDRGRLQPRLHLRDVCETSIRQMKRYVWDDYKNKFEKDLKQKPKPKEDDFPTMLKYVLNTDPVFRTLNTGPKTLYRYGFNHAQTNQARQEIPGRRRSPYA